MVKNSNNNKNNSAHIGQNGHIYQPLPDSHGALEATVPAVLQSKAYLPEVTFCNLSAEDLDEKNANNSCLLEKNRKGSVDIFVTNSSTAVTIFNNVTNGNDVRKRTRLISNASLGDSIESSLTEKKKPEIPDGGYGWVVVFASVIVSLIADGLSFSFGLIHTELLAYFQESPTKTAWISSLFYAVPLLMGPIWSNLVDKYGCRRMTIIGGVVSAFGFGISSVCNSVEMLYLTFGIISGLGLGIGYVTAVVSVAFWFDKKRTFATGIGASGTGIGTFLYAPLTQWLIDSYGWRGATVILSGTMLNVCVCGALMRDPDWLIEENRLESRSQSETTFSNSSVCLEEIKKMLDTGVTKEAVLDTLVTKNNTEANQQIGDAIEKNLKRFRSEIFLPTFLDSNEIESFYETRSASRRSLREREDAEVPSRENLLAMTSTGAAPPSNNPTQKIKENLKLSNLPNGIKMYKKAYLASVETLSSFEKQSFADNLSQPDPCKFVATQRTPTDVGYVKRKFSRDQSHDQNLVSSRFSLNENFFFGGKTKSPSLSNLKLNGRHNSLDILRDDSHCSNIQDEAYALIEDNVRKHNEVVAIAIPENNELNGDDKPRPRTDSITGLRRLSKSKKPNYRSHFRHNISMRNSNFLKDMRIHRNSIHYRGAMLNTHRYRLRASSCPNIYRNSMTTIAKEEEDLPLNHLILLRLTSYRVYYVKQLKGNWKDETSQDDTTLRTWYDSLTDTMKSIFDFSLFLDIKFALFNLSTLFLFIWFIIPYLYLPQYMKTHGYEPADSAQLISAIGVSQTIGMIGLGFLGDRSWMNVNICYAGCLLVCGVSVILMPLLVFSYNGLMAMSIIFGFTFASSFSFTPSILVSIVDLDDFTCAYGLVLLVQGVGMIAGPPIAGGIYEATLKWDDAFYLAGVFISLSGVVLYLIEFCKKRQ